MVDARRVLLQSQWINQYPIVGRTRTKVIAGKGLLWGHKSVLLICNGRGILPFKTARIRRIPPHTIWEKVLSGAIIDVLSMHVTRINKGTNGCRGVAFGFVHQRLVHSLFQSQAVLLNDSVVAGMVNSTDARIWEVVANLPSVIGGIHDKQRCFNVFQQVRGQQTLPLFLPGVGP